MNKNTKLCILMIVGILIFGLGMVVQGNVGIREGIGTMIIALGFFLFGFVYSLAPSKKPPDSAKHGHD